MKPIKAIGVALVAAAALGVVACNNDNVSSPDFYGSNSSAVENDLLSSSAIHLQSSSSNSLQSSSSKEVIVLSSGGLVSESSSSEQNNIQSSSSSVFVSSSSSELVAKCLFISSMCPKCRGTDCPLPIVPCNHCLSESDPPTKDCETGIEYVCQYDIWQPRLDEKCHNFSTMCPPCDPVVGCNLTNVPCNQCDSTINNAARDCESGEIYICKRNLWIPLDEPEKTCEHISDVRCEVGMVGCGACDKPKNSIFNDCVTGYPYVCHDGFWVGVSVQRPCQGLLPECGYSEEDLCNKYGLKEYCNDYSYNEQCKSHRLVGTACDANGNAQEKDGCTFICADGAWQFPVPPMSSQEGL